MRYILFAFAIVSAAFAALKPADLKTMPSETIEALLPADHPACYYLYAARLITEKKMECAIQWFYVGQLRYRVHLAARPELVKGRDGEMFTTLTTILEEAIKKHVPNHGELRALQITNALKWDDDHDNTFTQKTEHSLIHAQVRAGLTELGLTFKKPSTYEQPTK